MTAAAILTGAVVAIGLIGTVVPLLPGLWLIWLAMVLYGIIEGFGIVGIAALIAATLALAAGLFLGVRIPLQAASAEGLNLRDQAAGALCGVIGFFAVPVIGLPLGFVVGVFALRWLQSGDRHAAWASSKRTVGALLRASFAQFVAGAAMALSFAVWVYAG